jgi:hypothetical protein
MGISTLQHVALRRVGTAVSYVLFFRFVSCRGPKE